MKPDVPPPAGAQPDEKLDPEKELTAEELAHFDFVSAKPDGLKKLDAEIQAAAAEREALARDPLGNIYILTYKTNGPTQISFFRSTKQPSQIVRDCQVWCAARGHRYLAFSRALINLEERNVSRVQNSSDITELVTTQSRFFNEQAQKQHGQELSRGPVRD